MATYAIGDVQGCFSALQDLLELISYNPASDTLWFTGDLVNRGPQSVEVLRFVSRETKAVTVLGNHDLSLLALSEGVIKPDKQDTYIEVLKAPDKDSLLLWLRQQPLMHVDHTLGFAMAHAGVYPLWTIEKALTLADEVHQVLIGPQYVEFLNHMFGEEPSIWHNDLKGYDRLRFISNAFTRMRYCSLDGELNLKAKGPLSHAPKDGVAWFNVPNPAWLGISILFGHWASLKGKTNQPNIFALDTGCVWGECLTAICLETKQSYGVNCEKPPIPI